MKSIYNSWQATITELTTKMTIIQIKQAAPDDYHGILKLQHANQPAQLSEKEKQQGFVVSNFTLDTLDEINNSLGILVALAGNEITGFVCLTPTAPLPDHPVLRAMIKTFPEQRFNGNILIQQRVFIYGPVCISKEWRGRGILKKLFSGVKNFVRDKFDTGVAFIDNNNQHSFSAHVQGLGMTVLTPFEHDNHHYQLVAFSCLHNDNQCII